MLRTFHGISKPSLRCEWLFFFLETMYSFFVIYCFFFLFVHIPFLKRHFRENWLESPHKDIYDIITACYSTHWSERKEGLMGLQAFLRSGNLIPTQELRKLIEILGKMFTDAHTKVSDGYFYTWCFSKQLNSFNH